MKNGFCRSLLFINAIVVLSASVCLADGINTYSLITRRDSPELVFSVVSRNGDILTVRKVDSAQLFLSIAARTNRDIAALSLVHQENEGADHILAVGHDDTFMDREEIQMPVAEVLVQYIRLGEMHPRDVEAHHDDVDMTTTLNVEGDEGVPPRLVMGTNVVAPRNDNQASSGCCSTCKLFHRNSGQ